MPELIQVSQSLSALYPGLRAAAWTAERKGARGLELPSLQETAIANEAAGVHAASMSALIRDTGSSSSNPVEFQVRKAHAGELRYSKRDPLIDLLLLCEVKSGLIIGMHDASQLETPVVFGVGADVRDRGYLHISQKQREAKEGEPVLISGREIIASLIHGPDRRTRLTPDSTKLWGVIFSSPGDPPDLLAETIEATCSTGEEHGLWKTTATSL